MKQRIFSLAIVLVLTLLLGVCPLANGQAQAQPSPGTIYVPDDYPTIQGAVNASSPGDTIIVRDGSYTENIVVTTDHLTIRSENGAGATIVAAADADASVFNVTADYVSIAGFTVTGASGEYRAGINLTQSSHCDIRDNTAIGNYQGICLWSSHHNSLTGNTAHGNSWESIWDSSWDSIPELYSANNTLTGNTAKEGSYFGIRLYYSLPGDLECRAGINLTESSYCDISDNTVTGNYQGICLWSSHHNTLTGNTANGNSWDGILVLYSGNNTLTGNTANENGYFGIRLYYSPPNTLRNNSMERNMCNFYSWSKSSLSELRQDVDTSNIVDGRPVYWLLDKSDLVIDPSTNAGYVAVINSTNITVKDLTITHSGHAVLFAYTNNSRIENVTACYDKHSFQLFRSHNNMVVGNIACNNIYDGYRIWHSSNNTLLNNTSKGNRNGAFLNCSGNTLTNHTAISNYYGIYLEGPSNNNTLTRCSLAANHFGIFSRDSADNVIYLNEVVNNTLSVFSFGLDNIWESPQGLIYTYNGSDYTGRLGNYWGDYRDEYPQAEEIDSTGVWDTPYGIPVSAHAVPQDDSSPLVAPVSHYLVTGSIALAPSWLGRYWWAIVVGVIIAALLVCFLKKSKSSQ